MDTVRFVQVYIIYSAMVIMMFLIGLSILKRKRKTLNVTFSGFYICSGLAAFINIIYAPLNVNPEVTILHFITYFLFCFAFIFLLMFNRILQKSEKVFKKKDQLIIMFVYGGFLLSLALIPNGIIINESTDWKPTYSLALFLITIYTVSVFCIIPVIYYSIKMYIRFEDNVLKKKWILYISGLFIYIIIFYLTLLSNYLNIQIFRLIVSIASLLLFPAALLVYFGVGRQLKNNV